MFWLESEVEPKLWGILLPIQQQKCTLLLLICHIIYY